MDFLISLLRPIFLPLLKLDFSPPHLPEGSSLVRSLKPAERWLGYRYLQTLFGFLNQFIGVGVMAVLLVVNLGGVGIALTGVLLLFQGFVIGFALVALRVDYELRHYLVGDRSLRVVQGAFRREEVTLSYANVQNLEVNQGPLERFFGFKSLTISTAGADTSPGAEHSHLLTMVGLENADEVRELILGMLKHHRDSGLGDTQHAPPPTAALPVARLEEVRAAAYALRDAARTA